MPGSLVPIRTRIDAHIDAGAGAWWPSPRIAWVHAGHSLLTYYLLRGVARISKMGEQKAKKARCAKIFRTGSQTHYIIYVRVIVSRDQFRVW